MADVGPMEADAPRALTSEPREPTDLLFRGPWKAGGGALGAVICQLSKRVLSYY